MYYKIIYLSITCSTNPIIQGFTNTDFGEALNNNTIKFHAI